MTEMDDRQRIIEVATRSFLPLGLSKVTLDEIASELGMSKKTMYKFFSSKEDLLKEVVHTIMSRVRTRIEVIVNSDRPSVEKLPEVFGLLARQIGGMSRQFLIDLQRFAPELWREMDEFRRQRILTNVRRIFVQAKKEGVLRKDLDIELFILVVLNSVQGIVNPRVLSEQAFSMEDALRGIFTIIFEGAMTEEARGKFHLFENMHVNQSTER